MGCQITAIEDDQGWLNAVCQALLDSGVSSHVQLHYVPFDFEHPADFETSSYLSALTGSHWDVVIIDGQDKTFRERVTCFRHAEPLMAPGSIILVDDFWRYEDELLASHSAHFVKVFESVGPCRIGVTSTAMFFY
jgi:predicted O-methyltransferase YrrM